MAVLVVPVEPTKLAAPARVSPYSVIDITPFQEDQPRPPDPEAEGDSVSLHVPSGYVVPVPCGYAVPSSLPALLPAYSSPVVVHTPAPHEEGRAPSALRRAPCSGVGPVPHCLCAPLPVIRCLFPKLSPVTAAPSGQVSELVVWGNLKQSLTWAALSHPIGGPVSTHIRPLPPRCSETCAFGGSHPVLC